MSIDYSKLGIAAPCPDCDGWGEICTVVDYSGREECYPCDKCGGNGLTSTPTPTSGDQKEGE